MCERLTIASEVAIQKQFGALEIRQLETIPDLTNVKLGKLIPAVTESPEGDLLISPYVWGFRGNRGQRAYHARWETTSSRLLWHDSYLHRRAIVPVSSFTIGGVRIHAPDDSVLNLAAVWRYEGARHVLALLSQEAQGEVAKVFRRMPVSLPLHLTASWLDPAFTDPDSLKHEVYSTMQFHVDLVEEERGVPTH